MSIVSFPSVADNSLRVVLSEPPRKICESMLPMMVLEHEVHRVLKFLVVLSHLHDVEQFQQGRKVPFSQLSLWGHLVLQCAT